MSSLEEQAEALLTERGLQHDSRDTHAVAEALRAAYEAGRRDGIDECATLMIVIRSTAMPDENGESVFYDTLEYAEERIRALLNAPRKVKP